jgi:hypothetical protein
VISLQSLDLKNITNIIAAMNTATMGPKHKESICQSVA